MEKEKFDIVISELKSAIQHAEATFHRRVNLLKTLPNHHEAKKWVIKNERTSKRIPQLKAALKLLKEHNKAQ